MIKRLTPQEGEAPPISPLAAAPVALPVTPSVAGPKPCSLVVDDSRVVRGVARRIMEGFGYTVDEAENGEEALAKCRAAVMPDVILLDWNMPVMSGLQFVTALGEVPGSQRPKVVFCTTESGPEIVRAGIAAGASGFVIKPFNQQTLQLALARIGAL